jgi:hypothetical protein
VRYGGTDAWPAYEIQPTTPWNYGLAVSAADPGASMTVSGLKPAAYQPFTQDDAPVVLKAKAKRVPGWKIDRRMVGKVPVSPVATSEPLEEITLIPMGCARLRISVFPTVK